VLRLWPDRQGSPLVFGGGMHTIAAARTRAAITGRKLDLEKVRMVLAANGTAFSGEYLYLVSSKLLDLSGSQGFMGDGKDA